MREVCKAGLTGLPLMCIKERHHHIIGITTSTSEGWPPSPGGHGEGCSA